MTSNTPPSGGARNPTMLSLDSVSSIATTTDSPSTLRNDLTDIFPNLPPSATPPTIIELRFSASNLANADFLSLSDSFAVVYADHSADSFRGGLEELGRTETVVDNLSPQWTATLVFPQVPNAPNNLVIDIYDRDARGSSLSRQDFLGRALVAVPDILAAPALSYSALLQRDKSRDRETRSSPFSRSVRGTLRIQAEPLRSPGVPEKKLELRVRAAALRGRRPPWRDAVQFFEISRQRGRDWSVIFRSEDGVHVDQHGFVKFKPARIAEQLLHNMDDRRRLRFTFFSRNTRKAHDVVSFFETDAVSLLEKHVMPLQNEATSKDDSYGNMSISRVSSAVGGSDESIGRQQEKDHGLGDAYVEEVRALPLGNVHQVRILVDHVGNKQLVSVASDTTQRERRVRTTPKFISLH